MKYYLGIDGGGTKTKVCLLSEDGSVTSYGTSGPSSIDTVDINTSLKHIKEALNEASINIKNGYTIKGIFAGLGGMVTRDDFKLGEEALKTLEHLSNDCFFQCRNDMENALLSGETNNLGIALIVGTGMVAYGRNLKGDTHKAGGWGYKEGEMGSAYDLGFQAISKAVRSLDQRIKPSAFTQEMVETLNIKSPLEIVKVIDNLWGERTKIASFAKIVTKHANLNDIYAIEICDNATKELALAVYTVGRLLHLEDSSVVIIGSLGNAPGYFKEKLHQSISSYLPNIKILENSIDPALAAAKYSRYLTIIKNHNE